MAGYSFSDISIGVFDVHTTVDPYLPRANGFFQEPFSLMTDARAFNEVYQDHREIVSSRFRFTNVYHEGYVKEGFWKSYLKFPGSQPVNPWSLQLPLIGNFKHIPFWPNFQYNFKVSFGTRIYLSPLGWSTAVLFRLIGDIPRGQLIELVSRLRGRPMDGTTSAAQPFRMGGEPKSLTEIFRHCQDLLLGDVYQKGKPPHGSMQIPRQYVISINGFSGDIVEYRNMPPADQGLMLSILYGRPFDAGQVVRGETPANLWTRISGPNFALTDFQHGTLVFPQLEAINPDKVKKAVCLSNNIRDCKMMILTLLNFYRLSVDGSKRARITDMRKFAKTNLTGIKARYKNQFCQNYYLKNESLKNLDNW
jgi:hypothetical protein